MTNMGNKRWTKEEDMALVKAVSRKPDNLLYAFYILSKKIDRTPEAISGHYYATIKPYYQEHPEEAPFRLIGGKTGSGSIKNVPRNRPYLKEHLKKLTKPFKERFKEALKLLFAL